MSRYDYLFIVTIIGDSGAGKSCLLTRFAEDAYHEPTDHTIGVEYRSKIVTVQNGRTVNMQMWDTSGTLRSEAVTITLTRLKPHLALRHDH
jgi:small GTP-binding protein